MHDSAGIQGRGEISRSVFMTGIPQRSISLSGLPFFRVLLLGLTGEPRAAPAAEPPPVRHLLTWGGKGTEPGKFNFPIGIAIDKDEIFVTDFYNSRVQKFSPDGKLLAAFKVLPNPGGIAVGRKGNLYLSHFPLGRQNEERKPDRLTVYDRSGKYLKEWGKSGTGDSQFDFPGGMAIGRDGRVYVADQTNRRVQVFDAEGKFLAKWGEYGTKPGQFGGNTSPKSRVG